MDVLQSHGGGRRVGSASLACGGRAPHGRPARSSVAAPALIANAYWAGMAEIEVTPSTGAIRVTKFTLGVDAGKVINPEAGWTESRAAASPWDSANRLKEEVTLQPQQGDEDEPAGTATGILDDGGDARGEGGADLARRQGLGVGREARSAGAAGGRGRRVFPTRPGVQARRIPLTPASRSHAAGEENVVGLQASGFRAPGAGLRGAKSIIWRRPPGRQPLLYSTSGRRQLQQLPAAELADAPDSKSGCARRVWVRPPPGTTKSVVLQPIVLRPQLSLQPTCLK